MSIAFIINPVSGSRRVQRIKRSLPDLIACELDPALWSSTIVYTEYAGHARELAHQYACSGYNAVVAAGGDGTVSEIADGMIAAQQDAPSSCTHTALAVLPLGSGNGLARHLGVPMDISEAIRMLNHAQPMLIDYGLANGRTFICTCGTGFDALIAERFAASTKRGFLSYLREIIRLVFTYRPRTYRLSIPSDRSPEQISAHRAFLITFANANQWGNGARIAPRASLNDGLMDVMILSPYTLLAALPLAIRLYAGTIHRSPLVRTFRTAELTLHRPDDAPFHIDGDPVTLAPDIRIRIIPQALPVLAGRP